MTKYELRYDTQNKHRSRNIQYTVVSMLSNSMSTTKLPSSFRALAINLAYNMLL